MAGRKLDFQGDRIREGFKGRVAGWKRSRREGQRRFPRDTRLLLIVFRACVERGARAEALAMLDEALPLVTEPALRDRLRRTREALAAAPPTGSGR